MSKRILSALLGVALVASAFSALPAKAQTEPGATGGVIPDDPNIVDPENDANAGALPVTFTGADVLTAWFTHDATNLYTHIQTTTGARAEATTFQTTVGTEPGLDCVQLRMTTAGETNESFSAINVADECGDVPTTQYGPLLEEEGPDGTSILTGTYPREGLDVLAEDALLAEPDILVGMWGHGNPVAGGSRIGVIDETDVGTDYTISPEEKVKKKKRKSPPGKNNPPGKGKKKGCKKGKGKKRGACKKETEPPALACAAYAPGEEGAEAETTVVTDEATEEAPVEVEIDAPMGLPEQDAEFGDAHVFHNVQVDSADSEAGLYVRYEFQERRDYDLFLNYASGGEAARAAGFNTAPEGPLDGTGSGGHSETTAEQIDGLRSPDCQGYTARLSTYLGEGGALVLKLWLGEIQNDPAPDQRALVATVFGLF